ncbi:MAG: M24 family metallopeptidase [Alphaproteobacteria bacterium]
MHSTLLIGPYDWEAERLPQDEFRERIEDLRAQIAGEGLAATVIYGDSRNHAELGYLSNFVPKLGPAFMFIPREGEPRLLVSGAPNMLPAARRLTWIEKVEPLRDAGKTVLQWINESAPAGESAARRRVALIGGDAMRAALYRPFIEAFGPDSGPVDVTWLLRALMRHKRSRELALMREACAVLAAAKNALAEAARFGVSVTAVILEAERAAYHSGAQDVRTLFSVDGGKTLRPFEAPVDMAVDPLQAYIALRYAGYWVEGFVFVARSPHPAWTQANEALKAVIEIARAGTPSHELANLVEERVKPYNQHPMTAGNVGNSIGCFLEEAPQLRASSNEVLEAGGVYTLRAGASDGQEHHALASAMIAVRQQGADVLWSGV